MRIIQISADLSEASRCLVHATVQLPVRPSTTAKFSTPLWVQESHKPNGPVASIAGLHFFFTSDQGKYELRWKRNPQAATEYHVDVPSGVDTIHAEFDAILTQNVTRRIVLFGWEHVLMYPIGDNSSHHHNIDKIPIQASVTVPRGWRVASALQNLGTPTIIITNAKAEVASSVHVYTYNPTTVQRLADSPVLAGLWLEQHPLKSFHMPNQHSREIICIAADNPPGTQIAHDIEIKLSTLVEQTRLLFGDHAPYDYYTSSGTKTSDIGNSCYFFLIAASDHLPNIGGSEHFDSCAVILPYAALAAYSHPNKHLPILAHEFIHPWNGKFRRPGGHNPLDFRTPLDGRLLWVYEGLTQYYESVLFVRSSIWSEEDYLREVAERVAWLEGQRGRVWRSVEDTGTGVSLGQRSQCWSNWTREKDYYFEGVLIWLDVDTFLRKTSEGTKSLDDFANDFFRVEEEKKVERKEKVKKEAVANETEEHGVIIWNKPKEGPPRTVKGTPPVVEYTLKDIVDALEKVLSHDWQQFFRKRIINVAPEVNVDGIERAGYRFFYTRKPPPLREEDRESSARVHGRQIPERTSGRKAIKQAIWNSLGVEVADDGLVEDVRRGGPADLAKIAPRQRIFRVDKQRSEDDEPSSGSLFDMVALGREIDRSADEKSRKIRLSMAQEGDKWVVEVDYHDGLRYPRIERRDSGGSDLLKEILLQRRPPGSPTPPPRPQHRTPPPPSATPLSPIPFVLPLGSSLARSLEDPNRRHCT